MSDPLQLAVAYNDERIVGIFIDSEADVNAKSPNLRGRSLLHVATRNDNLPIARMLLERGAKVNDQTDDGLAALHIAVGNRSLQMVQLLLVHGARVDPVRKFNGKTPLYMAVEYDCPEIAELLLEQGASVEEATIVNTSVLHVALRIGAYQLTRMILDRVPKGGFIIHLKDNLEGKAPLHLAIERKQHEIVEILLRKGANIEEPCAANRRIEPMTSISNNPLSLAVQCGDDKMVALLLQNGAAHSANRCLHWAMKQHSYDIASLLLEKGIASANSVDENGLTALYIAVINGHRDMVELCLKYGGSVVTSSDGHQRTVPVLYYAVKNGDAEMVELLLDNGAPVNEYVRKNISILDVAIKSRSARITKLLLVRGAIINISSTNEEQAFALKYIAMLLAEGQPLSPENHRLIGGNLSWKRFYDRCREELERLRQEKVVGNISFYNVLTRAENGLAAYARNEEFVTVFPRSNYRMKFTVYADSLALNFTRGRVRNILIQMAVDNFEKLARFRLPSDCAQNVLRLLSNDDLRNFIRGLCDCQHREHNCLPQLLVAF